MQTPQYDHQLRVVSIHNLKAMCDHISGVCHRYQVKNITRNFIYVEYSNPDEYGSNRPIVAVFPLVPYCSGQGVVMTVHNIVYETDEEQWQHFEHLIDCPILWRHPKTGEWGNDRKWNDGPPPGDVEGPTREQLADSVREESMR